MEDFTEEDINFTVNTFKQLLAIGCTKREIMDTFKDTLDDKDLEAIWDDNIHI